jgi:hypothetical protein
MWACVSPLSVSLCIAAECGGVLPRARRGASRSENGGTSLCCTLDVCVWVRARLTCAAAAGAGAALLSSPQNVIVSDSGAVTLIGTHAGGRCCTSYPNVGVASTDFGLGYMLGYAHAKLHTFCGTEEYAAPELLGRRGYGVRSQPRMPAGARQLRWRPARQAVCRAAGGCVVTGGDPVRDASWRFPLCPKRRHALLCRRQHHARGCRRDQRARTDGRVAHGLWA